MFWISLRFDKMLFLEEDMVDQGETGNPTFLSYSDVQGFTGKKIQNLVGDMHKKLPKW